MTSMTELDADAAMASGHGPSSSESPPPANSEPVDLSDPRGELHAESGLWPRGEPMSAVGRESRAQPIASI